MEPDQSITSCPSVSVLFPFSSVASLSSSIPPLIFSRLVGRLHRPPPLPLSLPASSLLRHVCASPYHGGVGHDALRRATPRHAAPRHAIPRCTTHYAMPRQRASPGPGPRPDEQPRAYAALRSARHGPSVHLLGISVLLVHSPSKSP